MGFKRVAQVRNVVMKPFEKLEICRLPLSAPFHLSRAGCKAADVVGHHVIKEQSVTAMSSCLKNKKINRIVILKITKNTKNE